MNAIVGETQILKPSQGNSSCKIMSKKINHTNNYKISALMHCKFPIPQKITVLTQVPEKWETHQKSGLQHSTFPALWSEQNKKLRIIC